MSVGMITKSGLKERGWTRKLIDKFLPEPDDEKRNPYYRCAPTMKLYDNARVETIEKRDEFLKEKEKSDKRKIAAKKANDTKYNKLMDYADSVEITVEDIDKDVLEEEAINHYNAYNDSWIYQPDSYMLARMCVNYLRHCCTNYEYRLATIHGHVGQAIAYKTIKDKVFDAIKQQYPWLADECERQSNRMYELEDCYRVV